MSSRTNVEISRETWRALNSRKEPGDSFDDVIQRLLARDCASGSDVQSEPQQPSRDTEEHSRVREDTAPTAEDVEARMEATLREMKIKGRHPDTRKARRDAIRYAWQLVRESDGINSREIANTIFGAFWDAPLNYSTSSRYPGYGLWDNCVRDALAQLPGVEPPKERGRTWHASSEK